VDEPVADRKDESPHQPAQEQYHYDCFEHDTQSLLMLSVHNGDRPGPHHRWKSASILRPAWPVKFSIAELPGMSVGKSGRAKSGRIVEPLSGDGENGRA
jgi:hypothetical protein